MTTTATDTIRKFTPIPRAYTVVTHGGAEYFVTKVNPKNLNVTEAATGVKRRGPHTAFAFVRNMTEEDHRKLASFEDAAPKRTSTTTFGLGNRVRIKDGVKRFDGMTEDQEYVVIGVNSKTISIVPDGGYPDGTRYLRYGPEFLEITKAGYK